MIFLLLLSCHILDSVRCGLILDACDWYYSSLLRYEVYHIFFIVNKFVCNVGENRVGFFTKRDVEPGEELNFDYKYERYGQVRDISLRTISLSYMHGFGIIA